MLDLAKESTIFLSTPLSLIAWRRTFLLMRFWVVFEFSIICIIPVPYGVCQHIFSKRYRFFSARKKPRPLYHTFKRLSSLFLREIWKNVAGSQKRSILRKIDDKKKLSGWKCISEISKRTVNRSIIPVPSCASLRQSSKHMKYFSVTRASAKTK